MSLVQAIIAQFPLDMSGALERRRALDYEILRNSGVAGGSMTATGHGDSIPGWLTHPKILLILWLKAWERIFAGSSWVAA